MRNFINVCKEARDINSKFPAESIEEKRELIIAGLTLVQCGVLSFPQQINSHNHR